MPKKTNEEFKEMTINQISLYATAHPSEGARISKIHATAATDSLQKYFDYQLKKVMKIATLQVPSEN